MLSTIKELIPSKFHPVNIRLIKTLVLLLALTFLSMSTSYRAIGSTRCPKIKKHPGLKLKPIHHSIKEPFGPGDVILYICETNGHKQSIKCLNDGHWSELPLCHNPTNHTCPELSPLQFGSFNASVGMPLRVGTVVAFKCDSELSKLNTSNHNSIQLSPKYNLTGYWLLRCLPSSKWNHPMPVCVPVALEPQSNVGQVLTLTLLILLPILIFVAILQLFIRWKRRQRQRERWKQYFTDYKYRHSKTRITFESNTNTTISSNICDSSDTKIPLTDL